MQFSQVRPRVALFVCLSVCLSVIRSSVGRSVSRSVCLCVESLITSRRACGAWPQVLLGECGRRSWSLIAVAAPAVVVVVAAAGVTTEHPTPYRPNWLCLSFSMSVLLGKEKHKKFRITLRAEGDRIPISTSEAESQSGLYSDSRARGSCDG